MTFIKWLLLLIVTIAVTLAAFLFYMSTHDGPVEIFAGGEFQSGTVKQAPDWNTISDLATVELQTLTDQRSRTLWLAVADDRLFILSSYMNTGFGKVWKQWPHRALKDGRSLVRVESDIYELELLLIAPQDEVIPAVLEAFDAKYPGQVEQEHVSSKDTWIFELVPR